MMKNKAAENSAFATSSSGAAAAPAKVSSLKTPRTRKATPKAEATVEVAPSAAVPVESTKPKKARANSTAVTHRHKKLEIAPVAADLRAEAIAPLPVVEPTQEDVAKLAYSYYVARGYQPGNQAEDWFRAVTELRARLNS